MQYELRAPNGDVFIWNPDDDPEVPGWLPVGFPVDLFTPDDIEWLDLHWKPTGKPMRKQQINLPEGWAR